MLFNCTLLILILQHKCSNIEKVHYSLIPCILFNYSFDCPEYSTCTSAVAVLICDIFVFVVGS